MQPGGATDYADAMEAAYNELNAHGRPGVQKIIVLLSDGAANNGQNCVPRPATARPSKTPIHTACSRASRPSTTPRRTRPRAS